MASMGGPRSIGSILELVTDTFSVISRVHCHFTEAPEEVRRLRHVLRITQSTAIQIQAILQARADDQPPQGFGIWDHVQQTLEEVENRLREIYAKCHTVDSKFDDGARCKLLWAVKDRQRVQKLVGELEDLDSHLGVLIGANTLGTMLETRKLLQSHTTDMKALTALIAMFQKSNNESWEKDGKEFVASSDLRAQAIQLFDHVGRISSFALGKYGFRSDVIYSTKTRELLSFVRISAQLTFPTLSGPKALRVALSLAFGRPWYQSVDILGGHMSVNNVVPHDAPVVLAAKSGDVVLVERLINQRQASIADVTSDARPLLWYAIDSGSLDTVEWLVNAGANVKALTGPLHTELLTRALTHRNVAMARLLIKHKVDIDHINGVGMGPAHHLFQPFAPDPVDDELFTMLQSCGYSNLNVQDKAGETPLHRAACHGTAFDVQRLLKLGADPSLRRPHRGWTPIYCAAFYDNEEAFVELAKVVSEEPTTQPRWFTNLADDRGWTLLHVVADRSSMRVARMLLQAGADPFRLSSPSYEVGMCEEVRGQRVSPLFVAQHRGPDAIAKFVALLREIGHETYLDKEGDVFW